MSILSTALEESNKIQTVLIRIQHLVDTAQDAPAQLQPDIELARRAALTVAWYLIDCEKRAAAGHDVASTPELLERILSYLDCYKLWRITLVSRSFRTAVLQSKRLRQRAFLQADDSMDFNFAPNVDWSWGPFHPQVQLDRSAGVKRDPPSCHIRFYIDPGRRDEQPEPRGLSWTMLVCQPPIYTLKVHVHHECHDTGPEHLTSRIVKSSTGITVRDLFEAASEPRDPICLCHDPIPDRISFADEEGCDDAGWLAGNLEIEAPISFRSDDPVLECITRDGRWGSPYEPPIREVMGQ